MRNQLGSDPTCQSHVTMSLVPQRTSPRWKKWIPLISQQQRLRNLLQVMAFNVPSEQGTKVYYTLHVTSMSAPFYTSEKLHHPNPKWVEIEPCTLANRVNTAATGMVIRLWQCREGHDKDLVLLVWGLYLSGLIYLGPSLRRSSAQFGDCAVVLHMFGGFFTASQWLQQPISRGHMRITEVLVPSSDVRPSYNVQRLLRLRICQQNIKKQYQKAEELRKRIVAVGFGFISKPDNLYPHETNPQVRKILNRTRPKCQGKLDTLPIRRQLEIARSRVALLQNEKARKTDEVQKLERSVETTAERNTAKSSELEERYHELHGHLEELRNRQRSCTEMREELTHVLRQLTIRRRELMTQLNRIYPVEQTPDGRFTIRGIHLPNSEDFAGSDDIKISVALGFVTHVVQMLAIFLQVPLRYPVIHFGSRSKIVDNISEKLADKEREFPLFFRGRDRLQFNYGVYLLNKNIAQLRWLCNIMTDDLRPTLQNLSALVHLSSNSKGLDAQKRSLSGSSLDMLSFSANASPVGSIVLTGHLATLANSARLANSSPHHSTDMVGGGEHLFPPKNGPAIRGASSKTKSLMASEGMSNGVNLSYSLDKGLDEYGEIKKAEENENGGEGGHSSLDVPLNNLAHVGSEPILSTCTWRGTAEGDAAPVPAPASAPAQAPAPDPDTAPAPDTASASASDEDAGLPGRGPKSAAELNDKSEFSIVTERLVELVERSTDGAVISSEESRRDAGLDGALSPVVNNSGRDLDVERRCSASEAVSQLNEVQPDCDGDAVDIAFAKVTSRTEELASHSTSFNLVGGSRHASS